MSSAEEKYPHLSKFIKTSTIKGLPKAYNATTKLGRAIWIFAIIFGTSMLLYQLILLLRQYFSYPVNTQVKEDLGSHPPFPDIIICQQNPPLVESTYTDEYYGKLKDLLTEKFDKGDITLDHKKEKQEFIHMFYKMRSLYHNMNSSVLHEFADDVNNFVDDCFLIDWSDDAHAECILQTTTLFEVPALPYCMLVKVPDDQRRDIQAIDLLLYMKKSDTIMDIGETFKPEAAGESFASGFKVYIQKENALPYRHDAIKIAPGQETNILITANKFERLPSPYGKCSQEPYVEMNNYTYTYSKHACVNACYQKRIIEKCGCQAYDAPPLEDFTKTKSCLHIGANIENAISNLMCQIREKYYRSDCKQQCGKACTSFQYQANVYGVPWPDPSRKFAFYRLHELDRKDPAFTIYEDLREQYKLDKKGTMEKLQEVDLIQKHFAKLSIHFSFHYEIVFADSPALTAEKVVGMLGGHFNLWVGISFITAIEVVDALCAKIKSMCEKKKDKGSTVV